jgi:signal transduction histidine kinase
VDWTALLLPWARSWIDFLSSFADQTLTNASSAYPTILDEKWAVGSWIWTDQTYDKQTCNFWRAIDIPYNTAVTKAQLRITADNGFKVMLDGRELGRGSDWRWLSDFDLSWLLPPGRHVLAVEAFNDSLKAALVLGLRIQLKDGRILEIPSDGTWRVAPQGEPRWEFRTRPRTGWTFAQVVGPFHSAPWGGSPFGVTLVPAMKPILLRFWQQPWFQVGIVSLCAVALLLCARLLAKLAVQSRARLLLQRERVRIARDIHDDLGAGLTQLVLLGELAQNDAPHGSERQAQMEQLCEKTRGLLGTMDEIVWAVNSRRDSVREFATHACKYAQTFLGNTPIRCRLDIEPDLPDDQLDLPTRRNLFLALKEAISNAARHSGAQEIFLRVYRRNGSLEVTVEDNGKGFSLAAAKENKSDRNGLTNMEQRMSEAGGSYVMEATPGQGCKVVLTIPIRTSPKGFGWLRRKQPAGETLPDGLSIQPAGAKHSA